MYRRNFLQHLTLAAVAVPLPPTSAEKFVAAARAQVGVTTSYDPRYTHLSYPNGDVPRNTGVCADVIVRAYRDALALDLQRLIHEDMLANFSTYPRTTAKHTDPSIDHRRVVNLETYWRRANSELWFAHNNTHGDAFPAPVKPGDILTWRLNARLPHIGIVVSNGFLGPRVVHNWGNGAEEASLNTFSPHLAAGHYRWKTA